MLSRTQLNKYATQLDNISRLASADIEKLVYRSANIEKFVDRLHKMGLEPEQVRDVLIDGMSAITDKYGAASAELAARFYEQTRAAQIGGTYHASVAQAVPRVAIERNVRWAMTPLFETGDIGALLSRLKDFGTRCSNLPAHRTIMQNAASDKSRPRFARVPVGADTCEFCVMLASRGFVYATKKSAGELGQYHSNCRCLIAPGWGDPPRVEGYDPEKYFEQFNAAQKAIGLRKFDETEAEYTSRIMAEMRRQKKDGSEQSWMNRLTAQQRKDIELYTGEQYRQINRHLRSGGGLDGVARSISNALSKYHLEEDITVFRGVGDGSFSSELATLRKGDPFRDPGFMSTSLDSAIAENEFSGTFQGRRHGYMMTIDVPSGIGRGAHIAEISDAKREGEFLLTAGSRFEVVKNDVTNRHIWLRLVV